MKQESSSSGNRREFLDMMLNWDRSFGAHHPSATIKYTQDSYIQTQNLGEDLKTVLTNVIRIGRTCSLQLELSLFY